MNKLRWAALSVGILAGLVLLEGGLRLVGLPFSNEHVPTEIELGGFDEELGWSYTPGLCTELSFVHGEPPIPVCFDEQGLRIPQRGFRYDPERPSMLLTGGSYVFGHGLPWEQTLGAVLEDLPGVTEQAVNLGVQGYGSDQSLLMLRRHMDRFDAKLVVYVYIADHAYRNMSRDRRLLVRELDVPGTKPLFELRRGELRQVHQPRRFDELFGLRVVDTWRYLSIRHRAPRFEGVTRALVEAMATEAEQRGARFVLVHWRWTDEEEPLPADLGFAVLDLGENRPEGWENMRAGDGHHPGAAAIRIAAERIAVGPTPDE